MKECWLLWANLCFWSCFISSRRKRLSFHVWCRCSIIMSDFGFFFFACLFVFFYFWTFVTLWWWHHVMWRWVLYYFCTFVYKPVKKSLNLKSSVYAYISSLCPKQRLPPPPSLHIFHWKGWFGKHPPHPHPALSLSPSFPPCLPSRAQPRSPFSLFVIHLASSFHCRDKGAQCIVGRLSLKKGPLPCVCCGRDGFMLPPPHKNFSNTLFSYALFLMIKTQALHHTSALC